MIYRFLPGTHVEKVLWLRDGSRHQSGWIFGKSPNGLWPLPPHFRKIISHIDFNFVLKKPCLKVQNLQYSFLDWKRPPPLELFRKFIHFLVPSTRPLPSWATYTPVWFFVKLISLYYLIFQRTQILRNGEGSCCHIQAKRDGCCVCVSGGSDIISQFQTISWCWLRKINWLHQI